MLGRPRGRKTLGSNRWAPHGLSLAAHVEDQFLTSYMIGGLSALMIVAGVAGLTFAIRRLRD